MFNLTRGEEATALIAVILVAGATVVVSLVRGDKGKTVEIPLNKSGELTVQRERKAPSGKIMVHISGEVRRKGVLELGAAARVKDAIELAGATENADLESLNLAASLVDGERIVVPGKGMAARKGSSSGGPKMAGKVNINTASQEQLESLSGIGPVIAKRIVEFRSTRRFEKLEDLLLIKRIGPVTLEKVRDYVCLE